ncbi:MAG: XkdX family protein [Muribaculaceae bacterium]|nr:XkdX family protein [Muribaculaceae bacterium]MCM1439319.1 XkdX family protein [Roseburia sp.]
MNEIWANRLIAGTKTWDEVTPSRKNAVKAVLLNRVEKGTITAGQYEEITGETAPGGDAK